MLQLVAAKNDFLTYAIVTLFLDIKYNITWLNRTEPEPRFDEPNRTWTKVWWTEPEPEPRFDEPNPNLTRSSVRFGSIGTLEKDKEIKKYQSHRKIPNSVLHDLEALID